MKAWYKYVVIFKIAVIGELEYRMNFMLSLFSAVFLILIQFFLWKAVFLASTESVQFGYEYHAMISYVIIAGFVAKFVTCGFEWDISHDIKEGKLNNYVIKPISYMSYRFWNFFGSKAVQFVMIALVFIGLALMNASIRQVMNVKSVMLFIVSILLAMILNFFIYYLVATIAFWLQEIWGIFIIVHLIFTFASGGVFPLDVFGKVFMGIVKWLPFKYIVYYPVSLLIGQVQGSMVLEGILIQLVWVIILYLLSKLMWRIGLKNYTSVGG